MPEPTASQGQRTSAHTAKDGTAQGTTTPSVSAPSQSVPPTKPQLSGGQSVVERAAGFKTQSDVPKDAPLVAKNPYLARVKPGEPFFVLRAQDKLAPTFVRGWAERAKQMGLSEEKFNEAMSVADAMEKWPNRKMPD